jgi:hypothetical protein
MVDGLIKEPANHENQFLLLVKLDGGTQSLISAYVIPEVFFGEDHGAHYLIQWNAFSVTSLAHVTVDGLYVGFILFRQPTAEIMINIINPTVKFLRRNPVEIRGFRVPCKVAHNFISEVLSVSFNHLHQVG